MNTQSLIERVLSGSDPNHLIGCVGLTEGSPQDAKMIAKAIAGHAGGTVTGSKSGWGTDVAKISKGKAHAVMGFLKKQGFEDVSSESVYRQLIKHLGSNAWVLTNKARGVTVRIADVDEMPNVHGEVEPVKDLVVNVLYD